MTQPPNAVSLNIELPADQVGGSHADAASVWHTAESFVIDFLAFKQPPHPDQSGGTAHDMLVTSRIRMAPSHVIELLKALERQLSLWETETGQRPPLDPGLPTL